MVFTKDKHPHKWTLDEKKKLLEVWKSETDWTERSKKMYEAFPNRKYKGFFSPGTCHSEFDRLVHAPAPAHVTIPTTTSTAGYSLKTLVDIWVDYYEKEIQKDIDQKTEICMVEIRNCYATVERILNDEPKMTDDQLLALLEEARARDAKKDPATNNVIVNAYMRRLMAQAEEKKKNQQSNSLASPPTPIPPSKFTDVLPRGSETAFRSPSPSRSSPIKSPIRCVTEAIREGITPIKTETPKKAEPHTPTPLASPEQMPVEVPPSPIKHVLSPTKLPSPVKTPVKIALELTPQDEPVKNDEPMDIEPNTPVELPVPEPARQRSDSIRSRKRVENEHREVKEETPTRGRSTRAKSIRIPRVLDKTLTAEEEKPVFDLPERASTVGTSDASRSKKSLPKKKSESVKKETDSEAASSVAEELPEKFTSIECQTDITIAGSFHTAPEKKERRASTSTTRKTRSNTKEEEPVAEESSEKKREVGIQCSRLDLDRDDKFGITWLGNEKAMLVTSNVKKEKKDEEEGVSTRATPIEEDIEEGRLKAGAKREVSVVYDVEEWVGKSLLLSPGVETDEEASSISKRANLRKDEKVKEETIQTKNMLINTLDLVRGLRFSNIFLHPVSEKEAPGYSAAIKSRMDLQTLKKAIEAGEVANPQQLKNHLMRMYSNAVIYNSTNHDVNDYAKAMFRETLDELTRLTKEGSKTASSLPPNSQPRRGKVVEELSTRSTRAHLEGLPGSARTILRRKRPAK